MIAAGTRYAMGTLLRVETEASLPGEAERTRDLIFAEVQRLEGLLSRFRPDSEISSINKAAGIRPVNVGPETYDAIERSLDYARASAGAFDPVAGGKHHDVLLEPSERSAFLEVQESSLDLGGIGKGFALDRAMDSARNSIDLERVQIDFGGQLLFWRRDGFMDSVTVAIENPSRPGAIIQDFEISANCSVSTSSQAERPGHLIDRRNGRPANILTSATIAAPSATEAEAWSTALFVAGRKGLVWLENRPGVQAFLF